jgi:Glycosyl hydrolase catalytic core
VSVSVRGRRALRAAALAAVLAGSAVPPAGAVEVGMGDQKASMFGDPLYRELGLRYVRFVMPWDAVLKGDWERDEVDGWMGAAQAAGQEPLVAFGVSRTRPTYLPKIAEFERAFLAFRARYPWVTTFTPWNEANYRSQPTARYPQQAANFYNVMLARCPGCRTVAADVLDDDNVGNWLRTFRRYARGNPQLWGLHNYHEVNESGTGRGVAGMLEAVPGEVWLTETGGLVYQVSPNTGQVRWPYDEARAALATSRVFATARSNPRVTRIYFYHWSAVGGHYWDSGFVRADGRWRPALNVLRGELGLPALVDPPPPVAPGGRKKCRKPGARPGRGASRKRHRAFRQRRAAYRKCRRCRVLRVRAKEQGKRVPRKCRRKKKGAQVVRAASRRAGRPASARGGGRF